MTRVGLMAVVVLSACLSSASPPLQAQAAGTGPSGKIAVYDNNGAFVFLAPGSGRVIARIKTSGYDVDLSPDGRWMALTSTKGLVIQSVASRTARVIAHCTAKWCPNEPSWNGNSSEVAFELSQVVYTVTTNGLGRTRVIRGLAPDWSPRTSEIAFMRDYSYYTNAGKIYLAAIDGADLRYITRGAYPAFHPSGTRIAYSFGRDIYSIAVDGGHPRRIIRNGARPAWSPDGRYVAFTRETSCGHAVCSGRVFIAPASGSAKPSAIGPEIGDIGAVSWGR
jgi:Tol biopolymer transport system component